MAGMKISLDAAMRARDVSHPGAETCEAVSDGARDDAGVASTHPAAASDSQPAQRQETRQSDAPHARHEAKSAQPDPELAQPGAQRVQPDPERAERDRPSQPRAPDRRRSRLRDGRPT